MGTYSKNSNDWLGRIKNKLEMKLFDLEEDKNRNWLPYDGKVHYFGKIFSEKMACEIFNDLLQNINWQNDIVVIFGKKIITKRKVAWYGDISYPYTYSNTTKIALPWTNTLLKIKLLIEKETGETYNSCLLNLYHNGSEGMAWHSDNENDLKKNGTIASVSFGAERKFVFKHKQSGEKIEIILQHGSLLVMKNETQTHWLHTIPVSKKITQARINLTFRTIV